MSLLRITSIATNRTRGKISIRSSECFDLGWALSPAEKEARILQIRTFLKVVSKSSALRSNNTTSLEQNARFLLSFAFDAFWFRKEVN